MCKDNIERLRPVNRMITPRLRSGLKNHLNYLFGTVVSRVACILHSRMRESTLILWRYFWRKGQKKDRMRSGLRNVQRSSVTAP